jgi:hypothetical protein
VPRPRAHQALADVEALGRSAVLELINGVPIDVDAPIPYVVTVEGHAALLEALLVDVVRACHHDWQVAELGELYCVICGATRSMRRQSIPSYIGLKSEWKRR